MQGNNIFLSCKQNNTFTYGTLFQIRSDVQDSDQRGLLWMLDEETLFPGATDESFVERLLMHHGTENDRRKWKCMPCHLDLILF